MNKFIFKYQGFFSHSSDSLNVISCHKSLFQILIPVSSFTTLTSAFGSPIPPGKMGKKRASFTPILPRTPVQQQVSCLFVLGELSRNLKWNSTSKWIIFRTVRLKARKSQALIGKGRGTSHFILLFFVTSHMKAEMADWSSKLLYLKEQRRVEVTML